MAVIADGESKAGDGARGKGGRCDRWKLSAAGLGFRGLSGLSGELITCDLRIRVGEGGARPRAVGRWRVQASRG